MRDYKGASAPPGGAAGRTAAQLQVALYMLAARELLGLEPVGGLYQPLVGAELARRAGWCATTCRARYVRTDRRRRRGARGGAGRGPRARARARRRRCAPGEVRAVPRDVLAAAAARTRRSAGRADEPRRRRPPARGAVAVHRRAAGGDRRPRRLRAARRQRRLGQDGGDGRALRRGGAAATGCRSARSSRSRSPRRRPASCASAIRRRFLALGEEEHARAVDAGWIGTIHGFCARVLRVARRSRPGSTRASRCSTRAPPERLAADAYERAFEDWAAAHGAAGGRRRRRLRRGPARAMVARPLDAALARADAAGAADPAARARPRPGRARRRARRPRPRDALATANGATGRGGARRARGAARPARSPAPGGRRARAARARRAAELTKGAKALEQRAVRRLPRGLERLPPALRRPPRPPGARRCSTTCSTASARAYAAAKARARGRSTSRTSSSASATCSPPTPRPRERWAERFAPDHGRRVPGHEPAAARHARGARARQPVRGRRRVPVDLRLPPRRREDLPRAAGGAGGRAAGATLTANFRSARSCSTSLNGAFAPLAGDAASRRSSRGARRRRAAPVRPRTRPPEPRVELLRHRPRGWEEREPSSAWPRSRRSRGAAPRRAPSPPGCARELDAGRAAGDIVVLVRATALPAPVRAGARGAGRADLRGRRPRLLVPAAGPRRRRLPRPCSPTRSTRRRSTACSRRRSAASGRTRCSCSPRRARRRRRRVGGAARAGPPGSTRCAEDDRDAARGVRRASPPPSGSRAERLPVEVLLERALAATGYDLADPRAAPAASAGWPTCAS